MNMIYMGASKEMLKEKGKSELKATRESGLPCRREC